MGTPLLTLEFNGADGATTWTEDAQGLSIDLMHYCELDDAKVYSGATSLKLAHVSEVGYGEFGYVVPSIGGMFTAQCRALFDAIHSGSALCFWDQDGAAYLDVGLDYSDGSVKVWMRADDRANTTITNARCGPDITADTWHLIKLVVNGRDFTLYLDYMEINTWTAGIDNPFSGLDYFYACNYMNVGETLWLDEIRVADDGAIVIPVADMTLTAHAPYRHAEIPAGDMTLQTIPPDFGIPLIPIPTADMTLLARNPAYVWTLPAALLPASQVVFTCTLTGDGDGVDDLELPISSFQSRMRDEDPSYLACSIPNSVDYEAEILARTNGDIVVRKGYRLQDGTLNMEEIARVDYEALQLHRGARSDTAIISGHRTTTATAVKYRTLTGVSYYGLQDDGKRRIRAELDLFLRPGDIAVYGDESIEVGMISCAVNPTLAIMEVTEK